MIRVRQGSLPHHPERPTARGTPCLLPNAEMWCMVQCKEYTTAACNVFDSVEAHSFPYADVLYM